MFTFTRGAQPQRDVRRLQALVDDAAQLAAERVELDLVAQPRAEAGQRLRGVVAAAVEAAVDRRLDAGARGAEQRGDRQRRDRDREARLPDREPDQQHEPEVGGAEQRGERAVDERAVDDDVDVVEAVAEDRDRGGERRGHAEQAEHHPRHDLARAGVEVHELGDDEQDGEQRDGQQAASEREPLELLALDARARARKRATSDGDRDQHRRRERRASPSVAERVQQPRGGVDAERVARRRGFALSGPGSSASTSRAGDVGDDHDTRRRGASPRDR